jgi:hypothetical protein
MRHTPIDCYTCAPSIPSVEIGQHIVKSGRFTLFFNEPFVRVLYDISVAKHDVRICTEK